MRARLALLAMLTPLALVVTATPAAAHSAWCGHTTERHWATSYTNRYLYGITDASGRHFHRVKRDYTWYLLQRSQDYTYWVAC